MFDADAVGPSAAGPGRRAGRRDRGALSRARPATARSTAPARRARARRPRRARRARGHRPPRGPARARRASSPSMRRAALLFDIPLLFENGGGPGRQGRVVSAAPEVQRRARAGPAGMTPRSSTHPRPPAARRREARARRLRHPDRRVAMDETRASVATSSLASASPAGDKGHARNRFRHRDHRPQPAGRRPDGRDRLRRTVQPGRDRPHLPRLFQSRRPMPSEAEAVHGLSATPSCPTSRASATSARSCSSSSPICRWSRTMPASISASSTTSSAVRPPGRLHQPDGRHAGHRAPEASRRQAQPRRACARASASTARRGSSTAP